MYKDRVLKQESYIKLAEKLKEIDPSADINTNKKKLNTLRSNYRRELKKVIASKKSGASTDDIYLPSVWYFEELEFSRKIFMSYFSNFNTLNALSKFSITEDIFFYYYYYSLKLNYSTYHINLKHNISVKKNLICKLNCLSILLLGVE